MPGSRSARSLLAALAFAFSTITATGATAAVAGGEFKATVLSVGDGDTLRVSTGSKPITIRLACNREGCAFAQA